MKKKKRTSVPKKKPLIGAGTAFSILVLFIVLFGLLSQQIFPASKRTNPSKRNNNQITPTQTITTAPTATVTQTPPQITPTQIPLPPPTSEGIGPIQLSYKQGGIWLTPIEIANIPMNNISWDSLVTFSKKPMNIVAEITCTAGGACSGDTQTPAAMYARAIVGIRTNNAVLINELKLELDKVEQAINKAIDVDRNLDDKWPERNLGYIAVAANTIDYRPASLLRGLRRALIEQKFEEGFTIEQLAMSQLPNKPAYGRWSLLTASYLSEDWNRVQNIVKVHAKSLGEKNWGGAPNTHKFVLTGLGSDDNWQTLHSGGKADPIGIMPAGTYYQDHGVGGLYLADQYRAGNGPQWPPNFTDYIFEGMAPNIAISWGAHQMGYKNVFFLGNFAILRAMLFAHATHDGKSIWKPAGNDTWQVPAIMTWAAPYFGDSLPNELKPEPQAPVEWPLPISAGGTPGRGMGFMYATHYARLIR